MPMRRRTLSWQQQLYGSREGMRGGFARYPRVSQAQDTTLSTAPGRHQLAGAHDKRFDVSPAPDKRHHMRYGVVLQVRAQPRGIEVRVFQSLGEVLQPLLDNMSSECHS